jgi:peroxiredoxin
MKIRFTIYLLSALAVICGCGKKSASPEGPWLGVISIDTTDLSMDIPLNLRYVSEGDSVKYFEARNADEAIKIQEFRIAGETIFMKFPVFRAEIVAIMRNDSMTGTYYPKGLRAGIAYRFYALKGVTDRFPWYRDSATVNVTGRWKITENPGTDDSAVMVGEFVQKGTRVTGTILNTGGDYRYLDGKVSGNRFMVSAVDGAHTIILTAKVSSNSVMTGGRFLGSPQWRSTWIAVHAEEIRLPGAETLVREKTHGKPFGFAFPDLNGDTVTLADRRFKDKVVIVQAAGTWCPNCMDEVRFYAGLDKKFREQGLEIVALCFEDSTLADSKDGMARFAAQTGADYTFLYAGPRGRGALSKVFYNLDGPMAFPTTMFIDRNGKIRRVETGFSGPGTGEHYRSYVDETTRFIALLLNE